MHRLNSEIRLRTERRRRKRRFGKRAKIYVALQSY